MSHDNAISLSLATSHTANADPLATSTHMPPARFFEAALRSTVYCWKRRIWR
ncbi:replicase, partial [Pseudomonas syringae pv. pisi str. 1704B]